MFESFEPRKRKLIEGGSTGQTAASAGPAAKKFAAYTFSTKGLSQHPPAPRNEEISNDPLLSFLFTATDTSTAPVSSKKVGSKDAVASKNIKSITLDDPQFLQSQAIWTRMRIEATFDVSALNCLETSEQYREVLSNMKVWKFPPSKPSFPKEVTEKVKSSSFNPLDTNTNMMKNKENMVAITTAPKSFEEDLDSDPHSSFKSFLTKWQTVLYYAWDKLVEGKLSSFYVMGESSQDTSSSMIHHRNKVFTSLTFYRCGESSPDMRCIVVGANQSFLKRALSLGATFYSIDPIGSKSKSNRMSMSNLGSYQQERAGKSLYVLGKVAINIVLHCLVEEAFANFSNLAQQRKYQLPIIISEDFLPYAIEQSIAVQPIAFDDQETDEAADTSPFQDLSDSLAQILQRSGKSSKKTKSSDLVNSSFAVLGKGANIVRITGYLTPKIVMAVTRFLTELAAETSSRPKLNHSKGFSYLNPRNKPLIIDVKSTKSSGISADSSFTSKNSNAASKLTKSLVGLLNPMMISKSMKKQKKDQKIDTTNEVEEKVSEEDKEPEFSIRLDAPISRMIPFMISQNLDDLDAQPLTASQVTKENRQEFVKEVRGLHVIRQISWTKSKRLSVRSLQSCNLSLETRPSLQLNPLVTWSDLKSHHDDQQKEESIVLEPLKPYEIYVDNKMF